MWERCAEPPLPGCCPGPCRVARSETLMHPHVFFWKQAELKQDFVHLTAIRPGCKHTAVISKRSQLCRQINAQHVPGFLLTWSLLTYPSASSHTSKGTLPVTAHLLPIAHLSPSCLAECPSPWQLQWASILASLGIRNTDFTAKCLEIHSALFHPLNASTFESPPDLKSFKGRVLSQGFKFKRKTHKENSLIYLFSHFVVSAWTHGYLLGTLHDNPMLHSLCCWWIFPGQAWAVVSGLFRCCFLNTFFISGTLWCSRLLGIFMAPVLEPARHFSKKPGFLSVERGN